ncbi:MAG: flavoprotein, partial [Chloroflexota bacterium]|nr:flavoprotein [Chloroflexota bacterium]
MSPARTNPVVVGISGASGAVMARATVDELLRRDISTVALCSNAGRLVWQEELGENYNETLVEWQEHP